MREEMSALRAAVDANINGMKRDFDMKSGALKMMGEKVINLEREIKDLKQENKDIKEKIQEENNNFVQIVTPRVYTLEGWRRSRTSLRSSRTTTSLST